jgi:hypothetical protein
MEETLIQARSFASESQLSIRIHVTRDDIGEEDSSKDESHDPEAPVNLTPFGGQEYPGRPNLPGIIRTAVKSGVETIGIAGKCL